MPRPEHFVMRLSAAGGPPPFLELERIAAVAEEAPDGTTWIASRKAGTDLRLTDVSTAIALAVGAGGRVRTLRGSLLQRLAALPEDQTLLRDMYEGHGFTTFWRLGNPALEEHDSLAGIPGLSVNGLAASQAFVKQLSFAYWTFDQDAAQAAPARPRPTTLEVVVAEPRPSESAVEHVTIPGEPVHGVDFSGSTETEGRNKKLWIADWDQDAGVVTLRWGGDPRGGFGRAALPGFILEQPGTWVLDFPFGPASAISAPMGWSAWADYLAWTRSGPTATALRDDARTRTRGRTPWGSRRHIDAHVQTTWFPFFEQLYRQTILGAAEVLSPLAARSADVSVLPWHAGGNAPRRVVEGFPGFTIRGSLGIMPVGYKKATPAGRARREAILDALARSGVPVDPQARQVALDDAEGDAVDALALVYAAAKASRRSRAEWQAELARSHAGGWAVEGWFFD